MKKFLFSALLAGSFISSTAQDYLGYSSSNYNGVTGVLINPANVVESRMKFDMTLVGMNFAAGNNYCGLKRTAFNHSGKAFSMDSYYPAFTDPNFQNNYLNQVTNGKEKSIFVGIRVDGPSFLLNINRKNAIALTTASRTYFNADGITEDLARLSFYDIGRGVEGYQINNLLNRNLEVPNFGVTLNSWLEYGLTYGHVFRDKDEHYFKAGITAKYLQGIGSAFASAKNVSYNFNDTLLALKGDFNYGHSENIEMATGNAPDRFKNPILDDRTLNYTFGSKYPNFESFPGMSADFGFIYEWRPKYADYKYDMDGKTGLWRKDKNKYKLKVGVSLVDLGYLKYARSKESYSFHIDTILHYRTFLENNLYQVVNGDTIKQVDYQVYNFDKTIRENANLKEVKGTYKTYLPTKLIFQFDYNIWKDFYVNLTPSFAFQFKNKEAKNHDYMNISLTPRWDHRWFGVSIPISYSNFYGKISQPIGVGASVRLGPIILGSNRVFTYLSDKKDVFGADFYMLLKIPVPYHGPRDRDKDKVSDKKDKCKTVPGVWEFMGCPDRDGDHIQDSEDKCPDVPGIKELQGCPDRDGDGITDAEDDCPDDKGLLEFKGCPDRDGDKIIDKDDECPDDPGLKEFMGCPDKDGDGTPDKLDACPDIPGPKEYKGCPDRDGDTVLDKDDKCPDVAGPVENIGCPWPDTDKDGFIDKEDKCPTVPGVKEYQGCPPPPPIKPAEQKIIERAFKNLEFATGKDIIVAKSLPSLNELAKLLKTHNKDWTLKLSGHTDNQGNAEKNMDLSEKRANAVKRYLVKKGASADGIITEWFGQTQPIDSNDTPAGRQKNRRVEMKILFKETVK